MQLMPATAAQYAGGNPYDPAANIEAGARHLRTLLDRFAARRGAGGVQRRRRRGVRRFGGMPPFPETRAYVRRILTTLDANGSADAAERSLGRCTARPPSRGFRVQRSEDRQPGCRTGVAIIAPTCAIAGNLLSDKRLRWNITEARHRGGRAHRGRVRRRQRSSAAARAGGEGPARPVTPGPVGLLAGLLPASAGVGASARRSFWSSTRSSRRCSRRGCRSSSRSTCCAAA